MNKELIQKWVDWLRDPKNKQTKNYLCMINLIDPSDVYRCCLGGLAELYLTSKGLPVVWEPSEPSDSIQNITINQIVSSQHLPDEVFKELGILKEFHPDLLPEQYAKRAIQYNAERGWSRTEVSFDFLNDNLGLSFLQIADCIEHVYLKDGKEEPSNKASV